MHDAFTSCASSGMDHGDGDWGIENRSGGVANGIPRYLSTVAEAEVTKVVVPTMAPDDIVAVGALSVQITKVKVRRAIKDAIMLAETHTVYLSKKGFQMHFSVVPVEFLRMKIQETILLSGCLYIPRVSRLA